MNPIPATPVNNLREQIKKEVLSLSHLKLSTETDYDAVIRYKESGIVPSHLSASSASRYRSRWNLFTLEGKNLVYYSNLPTLSQVASDGSMIGNIVLPRKLHVLPPHQKDEFLYQLYLKPELSGFRGVDAFYTRIREEFLNVTKEDVSKMISTLQSKQLRAVHATDVITKPIVVESPMHHWQIDLIDESLLRRHNAGTTFLLVIIDCHSKYSWVIPLANKSAKLVAYEMDKLFMLEGAPKIIQSDNGTEFVNAEFTHLCTKWQIEQRTSQPHHPQSQGQVERLNGTLKRSLETAMAEQDEKKFLPILPHLVWNYNTTIHETIKAKPFEVHRGRNAANLLLSSFVADNLHKNAQKMIDDDLKISNARTEPIEVGNSVRILLMALSEFRKKAKENKRILKYSKETYPIVEVIAKEDGITYYRIDQFVSGRDLFQRHELLKIDLDTLRKPSGQVIPEGAFIPKKGRVDLPRELAFNAPKSNQDEIQVQFPEIIDLIDPNDEIIEIHD